MLSEQCSAQSASLRHGLTAHLPSAGINAADDLADADISSPADFSHQPQQHSIKNAFLSFVITPQSQYLNSPPQPSSPWSSRPGEERGEQLDTEKRKWLHV